MILILVLSGAAIGFLASAFGIGGGFFFTPFYHSYMGLQPDEAVATSLFQIPMLTLAGVITYFRRDLISVRPACLLLLASLVPSFITSRMMYIFFSGASVRLPDSVHDIYRIAFGMTLGSLGVLGWMRRNSGPDVRRYKTGILSWLLFGAGIGFSGSLFGLGGGFLAVPFFVLRLGMPAHHAIATSTFFIALFSLITGCVYLLYGTGSLNMALTAGTAGLLGGWLGANWSIRLSESGLRMIVALAQICVSALYAIPAMTRLCGC